MNIYVDMDGVLADFNSEPDGINRFRVESRFFRNLKPLKENCKALRKLIADGNHNIFILSASPNEAADGDKRVWLRKHKIMLPDGNIIICRNNERKVDHMKAQTEYCLMTTAETFVNGAKQTEIKVLKLKQTEIYQKRLRS